MNETISANPAPVVSSGNAELVRSCLVLTAVELIAVPVAALVSFFGFGLSTWLSSSLAAGICWLAAIASFVVAHLARRRGKVMTGVMGSMLVRMTIPLGIATLAVVSRSTLTTGGLLGQLLIFYLLTLTAETFLSISMLKAASRGPKEGSLHA